MKQLIQNLQTGLAEVVDVPAPVCGPQEVLVHTRTSLISSGTERMVVEFAGKNLVDKARARPDLVRQLVDKAQREGVLTALDAVRNRLAQPMALGYSSAGTVIDVGRSMTHVTVGDAVTAGDRVACAGGGYAVHAEVVAVPRNLLVSLPDGVDFEAAAFVTVGAIALQGVRNAEVRLGESVAVIGLGLLGQLTVQILKAAGCLVIGLDVQPQRAELALGNGADYATTIVSTFVAQCSQATAGHGVDAVIIAADTRSNQPVELAGEVARKKGLVVAVGNVSMTIPRKVYYEKELDFRISSSYGPGRYDPEYEEQGRDYPYAYVRWTENRNMQAFVHLLAGGKVDPLRFVTHRFAIADAVHAYDLIAGKTAEPHLGVLLTYPDRVDLARRLEIGSAPVAEPRQAADREYSMPLSAVDRLHVGVLGAGNYANATWLPALKQVEGVELRAICSGRGLSARTAAQRYGISYYATDAGELLQDPVVNTVAILTRHDLHAAQLLAALQAGKHAFVEKPLCLTEAELRDIVASYQTLGASSPAPVPPYFMVGFNRRFAPFIVELRRHLQSLTEPLSLHYRVNAGYLPSDHWLHDPVIGGGRLLGEGCHFLDLLVFLAGAQVVEVSTHALDDVGRYRQDNFVVRLQFANSSIGILTYLANGDKRFGKELIEVFGGGMAGRVDDYRTLRLTHNQDDISRTARLRQDKGHRAELLSLATYLTGRGPVPMSFAEIVHSTLVALAAQRSLEQQRPIALAEFEGL